MRSFLYSAFLLTLIIPGIGLAATLSINPASGSYSVGDTVVVKVLVASPDASINAVSGVLSISPSVFSIESISKSSSVLNFWPTEPSMSRSAGTVDFGGVAISGYKGPASATISITLRAIRPGTGNVSFESGQVLANDGNGTDITSDLKGASFRISSAPQALVPKVPAPVSAPIPEAELPVITPPPSPLYVPPPVVVSVAPEESLFAQLLEWLTQAGLLLALSIVMAFFLGMLCARSFIYDARSHETVHDALAQVDAKVHKAFLKLRESINAFLADLEEESARRTLTPSEKRFIKKMTKSIKDTEEVIEEDVHRAGK